VIPLRSPGAAIALLTARNLAYDGWVCKERSWHGSRESAAGPQEIQGPVAADSSKSYSTQPEALHSPICRPLSNVANFIPLPGSEISQVKVGDLLRGFRASKDEKVLHQ